jgi:hypothetical protein
MTLIERIVNTETNEIIENPYNADQLAEVEEYAKQAPKIAADKLAAETAKAAILERLGITAEEAALLIG